MTIEERLERLEELVWDIRIAVADPSEVEGLLREREHQDHLEWEERMGDEA